MNPLPVQPAKIHCPPRRHDTLSRERLNSWLDRAVAGRLALIVAEAGFGKTTLLADWAGQSRRLTTWYRLEPDDRDWLTFIRHLVAGGRELDPGFAPETFGLLLALGPGGPTQADLTRSIARELAELGASSPNGLTLILDDYHVVDGCPDTDPIVKALLERAGPGFSLAISTRSMPKFSIGRLRARGAVLTLEGADLCFDVEETTRLFRDAYHHPLDADVVVDLCDRTEGWAALLTLVRTSLEEHDDARALVAHLDASHGDLYEFLAEEVLAALPVDLQRFLERVALLTAVDLAMARLVDPRPTEAVAASIDESERLGLLSRPDRETPHRFHPLVREFLVARLTAEIGADAVREMHRAVAIAVSPLNWHAAAYHFLMAGDVESCARIVDAATEEIVAAGSLEEARQFTDGDAGDPERPAALILRSKIELGRGRYELAANLARAAVARASGGSMLGMARVNLASILGAGGPVDEAVSVAREALGEELSPTQTHIARASLALWQASDEGDLSEIAEDLRRLARKQERDGLRRYAGITRLNLAGILLWLGETDAALSDASAAEALLGGRASATLERVSASAIKAVALAQSGRLAQANQVLATAVDTAQLSARDEIAAETARIAVEFGAVEDAETALRQLDPSHLSHGYLGYHHLVTGQAALRRGDAPMAQAMTDLLREHRCADAAGKLRSQILMARVAILVDANDRVHQANEAARIADAQRSRPGRYMASLLISLATGSSIGGWVAQAEPDLRYCWSLLAEELASRIDQMPAESVADLRQEAQLRPDRWRSALRLAVERPTGGPLGAATMLAEVGSEDDAAFLRASASTRKSLRPAALAATLRLAQPVFVSDLGVVEVVKGGKALPRGLRRKVLALMCYLSSRTGMAANRDEALDALWPDLSPDAGGNSLHQAIYFLRRVLEPDFREGMTAGYIQVDGDVVSLNSTLVDTASRDCWRLLRRDAGGDTGAIDQLLAIYTGRYALDFAYEDWAASYRENLHAAVLASIEAEQVRSRRAGEFDRAIWLGHSLLRIDPQADAIELELLRAYKSSGRQAAAAEQYTHYAALVRGEFATEPPSFDDI